MPGRIIIADTGALHRLSAFDLDAVLQRSDRYIVVVDLIEFDACDRTPKEPASARIRAWIARLRDRSILQRAITAPGIALSALRERSTAENTEMLARLLHEGPALALRDYIEGIEPGGAPFPIIVYERPLSPFLTAACESRFHMITTTEFLHDAGIAA